MFKVLYIESQLCREVLIQSYEISFTGIIEFFKKSSSAPNISKPLKCKALRIPVWCKNHVSCSPRDESKLPGRPGSLQVLRKVSLALLYIVCLFFQNAGEESVSNLDKIRYANGGMPTADLRLNMQKVPISCPSREISQISKTQGHNNSRF